jgi:hypothetical protein
MVSRASPEDMMTVAERLEVGAMSMSAQQRGVPHATDG